MAKAGVPDNGDDGCMALEGPGGCAQFIARCRQLRFWAREAGVHPAHLSRAFRDRYRETIHGRVRRLRLEWAARRLVESDDPIAGIALAAGFADQSHLTRALKAHTGLTPAAYRRERSG